jgi:hypothetical protein
LAGGAARQGSERRIEAYSVLSQWIPRPNDRRVVSASVFVIRMKLRPGVEPAGYDPHKAIDNHFSRAVVAAAATNEGG